MGSLIFVFLLTALSNFQMSSVGEQVKAGLIEVSICLVVAVIASATIHRVAITVGIIIVCLFFRTVAYLEKTVKLNRRPSSTV